MTTTYLPFLPPDNAAGTDPAAASAVSALSADLGALLRKSAAEFWRDVAASAPAGGGSGGAVASPQLARCLDSFLRYRWRPDELGGAEEERQGGVAALALLSRRVLAVYCRLVGLPATATAGAPSSSTTPLPAAATPKLLKRYLGLPQLMDLAALFGPANPRLVRRLAEAALRARPALAAEAAAAAEPLASNLLELRRAVGPLARACVDASGPSAAASPAAELAQTAAYLEDASRSVRALVAAAPPLARALLLPGGGEGGMSTGALLAALAAAHDLALPEVMAAATAPAVVELTKQQATTKTIATPPLTPALVARAAAALADASFCLVRAAFLSAEGARALPVPDEGSSSSSALGDDDDWRAWPGTPERRGERLMACLMSAAHPPAAHGSAAPRVARALPANATLLPSLARRHGLLRAVAVAAKTPMPAAAVASGPSSSSAPPPPPPSLLSLDDAQWDYLAALSGVGARELDAARAAADSAAAAGAAPGASSPAALSPDLREKAEQLQAVLPDYGAGFLAAALSALKGDSEAVVAALLDDGGGGGGSAALPSWVRALDRKLEAWSPSVSTGAAGGGASGSGLSWTALAGDAAAMLQSAPRLAAAPPISAAAPRAAPPERRTMRVLGALPSDVRARTRGLAHELQYEEDEEEDAFENEAEAAIGRAAGTAAAVSAAAASSALLYDDEYDDSFDDLVSLRNDGVAEAEGDEEGSGGGGGGRGGGGFGGGGGRGRGGGASMGGRGGRGFGSAPFGGGRGGPPPSFSSSRKPERLWILDGRLYNYAKPGAKEVVGGREGADRALAEESAERRQIHGLGPGGNVPLQQQQPQQQGQQQQQQGGGGPGRGGGGGRGGGSGGGRGGRGGGRGGGGGGAAGGESSGGGAPQEGGGGASAAQRARKEHNKAAVGNHHRKDRAFKKMGL
jgi:activating signal cointegrator complex subunit 2